MLRNEQHLAEGRPLQEHRVLRVERVAPLDGAVLHQQVPVLLHQPRGLGLLPPL